MIKVTKVEKFLPPINNLYNTYKEEFMEYITVFTTFDNEVAAKETVRKLLKSRLIACANIIPKVTSVYEWNGEIIEDSEYLTVLKTKKNLFENLKSEILKLHPYEIPEIISLDITAGSVEYLKWIDKITKAEA